MARRRQHGEGSVYQRSSDSLWVTSVHMGWQDGRRQRRTFAGKTPEAALDKRDEFLDKKRDGFVMPRGRQPYVDEWVRHWLYNIIRGHVRERTWEGYRSKAETLVCPYFEKVPLSGENGISEEHVEEWQRKLAARMTKKGTPLSSTSRNAAHGVLSMALKQAEIRKRIHRNPARNTRRPEIDTPEILPPTEEEICQILDEAETWRTGPRWDLAIGTGLRQGEGLGLLWPCLHIDKPETATLDVQWELVRHKWRHGCDDPHACGERLHRYPCPRPCPKIRVSGRPHACITGSDRRLCAPGCEEHARSCPQRAGGGLRLERPKSRASRATIDVPPYAAGRLGGWKKVQAAERLAHPAWTGWAHDPDACPRRLRTREIVCPACGRPARPDMLVFTQPNGLPVDPRADWQDWSDLIAAAGLEHYRSHDGRHALATTLLEHGADIRVVKEIMRHASPDFTRRVYQHVRPKLTREASMIMDKVMRRGR